MSGLHSAERLTCVSGCPSRFALIFVASIPIKCAFVESALCEVRGFGDRTYDIVVCVEVFFLYVHAAWTKMDAWDDPQVLLRFFCLQH